MSKYKNIEKVKRLDFDRLDMLVLVAHDDGSISITPAEKK